MAIPKGAILFFLPFLAGCTSLLYYPNSYRYVDESVLERPPTEVELEAGGQKDLLSWYFEAEGKFRKPITIVFAHGNGQNMSAHFRSLYWSVFEGLNFLVVGYPGYGPNGGRPSPDSTIATLKAAVRWVQKNRPGDALFIFGQSLGGNIALRTLSESPEIKPCGVAIEGSFSSYQSVARKAMSRSWLLWPLQWLPYLLISDSRAIEGNFKNLPRSHYLVIHGEKDPFVPLRMGRELFEMLPSPKEFWEIEGGKHIDAFAPYRNQRQKLVDFVVKSCSPPRS